jgi:hypothetical protein
MFLCERAVITEHGDAFLGGHAEGGEDAEHAVDAGGSRGQFGVSLGGAGGVGVLPAERDSDIRAAVEGHGVAAREGDDVRAGDRAGAHLLHVGFHGVDDVQPLHPEVPVRGHLPPAPLNHYRPIAPSLHAQQQLPLSQGAQRGLQSCPPTRVPSGYNVSITQVSDQYHPGITHSILPGTRLCVQSALAALLCTTIATLSCSCSTHRPDLAVVEGHSQHCSACSCIRQIASSHQRLHSILHPRTPQLIIVPILQLRFHHCHHTHCNHPCPPAAPHCTQLKLLQQQQQHTLNEYVLYHLFLSVLPKVQNMHSIFTLPLQYPDMHESMAGTLLLEKKRNIYENR